MCGLSGFFSGCKADAVADYGQTCTACKAFGRYRSVFGTWDEVASVRSRGRQKLQQEFSDPTFLAMPKSLVPVLNHSLVVKKGVEVARKLSIHHLYRYMKFTAHLETLVVSKTVVDLAMGRIFTSLPESLVLDAHRIHADEAYHALCSVDIIQQVRQATNTQEVTYKPSFLKALAQIEEGLNSRQRSLARLYFVIISETLITGFLKQDDADERGAISNTIHDHLKDEVLHHAFFKQILFAIWPNLDIEDQDLLKKLTRPFILAFLMPDLDMVRNELEAVGFGSEVAKNICIESYLPEHINEHVVGSTTSLRHYLEKLEIEIGESFAPSEFSYDYQSLMKEIYNAAR